jgi:hypothetical protein
MFLPLFIAILLGFVSPSNTNCNSNGTTVHVSGNETPDDGTPADDTGGEIGDNPPR